MDIIKNKNIFLGFSVILIVVSVVLILFFGLKAGIDLNGGTQWQFSVKNPVVNEESLKIFFKDTSKEDVLVKRTGDGDFLVRLSNIDEKTHSLYLSELSEKFGEIEEKSFSSVGPAIGLELRNKAFLAIVFVLLGISLYIAYAFRKVSKPIQSWKYGIVTLLTLFHDVIIPTGFLAFLGKYSGVEIDTNFIVALLVVMGFSVHDTIVVFDRIRENLVKYRGKNMLLGEIINKSVHETFVRSLNTSLTLFIVLVAIMIFGPDSLFYFVLTILIGTIFGTYSSIFVASPLIYMWDLFSSKKR